jgi:hypothetical protein
MEYKKSYLFSMGVLFLVWMLSLFIVFIGEGTMRGGDVFWYFGTLASFLMFCQHVGRKMHRPKGVYLLLPASKEEKYTALLLESLVYFVGFQIVFWGGLLIWKPFIPRLVFPSLSQICHVGNLEVGGINGLETWIFFIASLLFLSYMSFRKHALLIAVGGMVTYVFLFILAAWNIVEGANLSGVDFRSSWLHDTLVFLADSCWPVMLASTLVVMYVAYLKLKEKEQR